MKYLVSLERPTRAEWDHILQHIARPLKEQNPLDSSLSDSSEASERGPYDESNKEEILLRNKASCRIRRSRKKTVYSIIKMSTEQSRLDWDDNGEGYCEVS